MNGKQGSVETVLKIVGILIAIGGCVGTLFTAIPYFQRMGDPFRIPFWVPLVILTGGICISLAAGFSLLAIANISSNTADIARTLKTIQLQPQSHSPSPAQYYQSTTPQPAPADPTMNNTNFWHCPSCGKKYPDYITACTCGQQKPY